MKKYIALRPFSTNIGKLCINGDIVYAELVENKIEIYDAKSRDFIGCIDLESAGEKLKEQ